MEKLGERKEKLDAYFRGRSLYAADQLAEAMGVTAGELDDLLVRPPRTRREDTEVRGGKREMLLRGGTLK
jgi:hypothetical protein